ncbi:hypothetical protein [Streptomyces sp. MW-W600-10]|uniref:hypothetical protein n=1 Tax=Streptomyces sp. MW-W600-10 TaxID=2829819 RepID=UPI001C489268|nr:hypothetical protein [Streptomyces sp. MW-W600-10]MBV7248180.1 hypothetical protein [Streptomyces sp. MW-W600-10]
MSRAGRHHLVRTPADPAAQQGEPGCTGSSNLLVRHIDQGRVEAARIARHKMTALAHLIHRFAVLLDFTDGDPVLS